ncbi:DUF4231 domain-containing protein [Limnofasciculus baicalensis]|uniref:DUF4231 domain-containing protein n=1 Tax=Limnofasciculus baicalensis BBK-W-15 TaxID=2699891 RepID=A0AAE3GUE5_9CYAN|nr:DUF4231 domain-containing protein [Limnofasciculus baicalensis]MCP2730900.1 DUF4231 domain-containing protein [Limnofasciculus baicalensis BBK-W-15]
MTNSEVTKPTEVPSTFTESSGVLSESLLSFMKIVEYLCLAAFIGTWILSFVFQGNQLVLIWTAILLSGSIFFILLNRKLLADYKRDNYEAKMSRKAEIYAYLLMGTSIATDSLKPARETALQYCQELIEDYKKTRTNARNIYYSSQISTIVLSGITPILVLVDKLEAGSSWLKWLPVIFPAVAAIVTSIVTSFPFQETWIAANATVELLEAEIEKFVLGVTPSYRCYDIAEETQRQQQAKIAIENFIIQVNNIHLKQVTPDQKKAEETKMDQT